jgi:cobalt-zinc-cadmium efflux system outer membrane protein
VPAIADTPLTLPECEQRFVQSNLLLLAEKYSVAGGKALAIQASIWDLPQLSFDVNAYNPSTQKLINVGPQGQTSAAVQQLLYLGGKKSKEYDLAMSDVSVREARFEQLLRDLRYKLRVTFYNAYFLNKKINFLVQRVQQVDSLAAAYSAQTDAGNISLRESVRLQALALSIRNDLLSQRDAYRDVQNDLRTLIQADDAVVPVLSEDYVNRRVDTTKSTDAPALLQKLYSGNAEIIVLQRQLQSDSLNLTWQRSLAVPDLTVGASYDQRGGAFNNQINVGVSLPLPLWNKNRGNIELAGANISQTTALLESKKAELKNQLRGALALYESQTNSYAAGKRLHRDLDTVFRGVLENFARRNLSLIDFTDFIESYVQSVISIEEAKTKLLTTEETINYLTGEDVF